MSGRLETHLQRDTSVGAVLRRWWGEQVAKRRYAVASPRVPRSDREVRAQALRDAAEIAERFGEIVIMDRRGGDAGTTRELVRVAMAGGSHAACIGIADRLREMAMDAELSR